ncbi:glycosyltransferase [Mycetocola manganoxydans]|uniref:glycosyltransferase n=1 Tax=Mycetocola manganoxydans TaxID=699879 RepID=UPI0011C3BBD7|nr:glycosyltransferase [Mycetocola manganoxydans]
MAPETPIRLYVAPVNWAGQGWQWARAAERFIPGVGAVSMAYRLDSDFGFPVDVSVPVGAFVLSGRWQREQRRVVLSSFTHVLLEAERHVFGRVYDQSVVDQARDITSSGVSLAMLCHGSDIRLPSRHAARHEWSPFADAADAGTAVLEKQASANRRILDEVGAPVFVSTPDLILDVPEATWLPVVVDAARWSNSEDILATTRPRVVHAPSKGSLKGSDLIDPVLAGLAEEGLIDYRRVEGVPAAQMPDVYHSADIVLDQFRIGSFGVAACEAMAAGRIVVGHVTAQAREYVEAQTGLELPIVEATPDSIEAVIRDICARPDHFRPNGARGRAYVESVHDGRFAADVLRGFLTT